MAKKQSHQQRLIDSMKSLGTARTPITAAYESGKDRNILPKDIKSTREVRGQAKRILVPAKIEKPNPPRQSLPSNPTAGLTRFGRPAPSASYLNSVKLSSWNPLKGVWDTRNVNSFNEIRTLGMAGERYTQLSRDWNEYNRNIKEVEKNTQDRTTATQKKKLKAIASKRNGARKAISRAKGSRGGLSRAGGLRGGSR
jgi:uncharacterized protein YdcH (DUF465 family)